MGQKLVALILVLAFPAGSTAGPLKDAIEKAARQAAATQAEPTRSRARFWTGLALIAGGGVTATLGAVEFGDDETGPDDGEDFNESDDGEDSDGWGNKAMLGGGIAAAALGSVLLLTGKTPAGTVISAGPGGVRVRKTIFLSSPMRQERK
jgi:hypothetical protein